MYEIINNLPIDYEFNTKSTKELKLYNIWFTENKSDRINQLIKLVKSTPSYEKWNPDFTLDSLDGLGKWFYENLELVKLTKSEYDNKRKEVPSYIEIDNWDLSIRTRSLVVDIGIYFGEVFVNTHKQLKWEQYFSKNKKDVDNGHMVIPKFGKLELNPILVTLSIAWGLARKTKNNTCLYDLFKIWQDYL